MIMWCSPAEIAEPIQGRQKTADAMVRKLARLVRAVAGVALIGVVVLIPWLRGGTAPAVVEGLTTVLLVISGAWLVACVLERRRPGVAGALLLCVVLLLVQGVWMSWNAGTAYDPGRGAFMPLASPFAGWPGAVDASEAWRSVLLIGGVMGTMLLMAELGREAGWRRGAWIAMAGCGAALAGYGLLQKAGVVPPLNTYPSQPDSVFASFADHGTAAAFINASLVLCLGGAICAWRAGSGMALKCAATVGVAVLLAGALVNISRAGMAIMSLIVLITGVGLIWSSSGGRGKWVVPLVMGLSGATVLVSGASALQRWSELPEELSASSGRLLMWRTAWPMALEGGALGHGPGSYKLMLPHTPHLVRDLYRSWIVTPHVPGDEVSRWSHAHSDYLQTWVEWGWLGGALWGVIVFGGIWMVLARRGPNGGPAPVVVGGALGVVLLHAVVDFPLQIASVQLWFGVLLGLAWSSGGWGVTRRQDDDRQEDGTCDHGRGRRDGRTDSQ